MFSRMRAQGGDVARFILRDARRSDRLRGRTYNLTKGLIETLIAGGCHFCGETGQRMTLDRIDNAKGHTTENVVAACIFRNYARRDMPYEAWLCLVEGMRREGESGLFGDWTGRAR